MFSEAFVCPQGVSLSGVLCPGGLCTGLGGVSAGGSLFGEPPPPRNGKERAVRILLECILVFFAFPRCSPSVEVI